MGFLIKYFYYIPIHAAHAYIIPINHNELKSIPKIQIKEIPEVFILSFFNLIEDTSPKIPVHNPKIHPSKIQKIKNGKKGSLIYLVLKKFSVNVINITNKINKTGERIENKLNIKLAFFCHNHFLYAYFVVSPPENGRSFYKIIKIFLFILIYFCFSCF